MDQKSHSSHLTQPGKDIPTKWQERFIIKRIDERDIEITLSERDGILRAMNLGQRFVQVRKHTLMINTIKSIDPKWGESNIPPRPKEEIEYSASTEKHNTMVSKVLNQEELDEWDDCFSKAYAEDAKTGYTGIGATTDGSGKNTDSDRLSEVPKVGAPRANSIEGVLG